MPYHKEVGYRMTDTSFAAAAHAANTSEAVRNRVIAAIQSTGPMTADETARVLDLSVLAVRPRFTELRLTGKIRDTGKRRKNESGRSAIVWAVVEHG